MQNEEDIKKVRFDVKHLSNPNIVIYIYEKPAYKCPRWSLVCLFSKILKASALLLLANSHFAPV